MLIYSSSPLYLVFFNKNPHLINNFKHDSKLKKDRFYTNVSILSINKYTPGKALNLGIQKSKFDKVLIISSHCVLKNINISKHINDLKKYVCIFGKQNPIWRGKRINKRYIWSHFADQEVVNMYSSYEIEPQIKTRFGFKHC